MKRTMIVFASTLALTVAASAAGDGEVGTRTEKGGTVTGVGSALSESTGQTVPGSTGSTSDNRKADPAGAAATGSGNSGAGSNAKGTGGAGTAR